MKVSELIKALSQCNPDQEVYAFDDQELRHIVLVDELDDRVDLNLGFTL
jgi:hypothetical protein